MIKRALQRAGLIVLAAISLIGVLPQTVSAGFDPNNLMNDAVFENTTTMNAGDVNNFLNRYAASCLSMNNGFQTADPTGWSTSEPNNHGYTFGGNVSGGQAIYDAARIYNLNPQVLLTTMQKEQTLVTGATGCHPNGTNPGTACPYAGGCMDIAMGYACPGGCDDSYKGFSLQLIAGAWILRFAQQRSLGHLTGYVGHDTGDENIMYSGPMTPGVRKRSASSPAVTYDGSYTTVNGVSVTIASGATASLYSFTPFTTGNQKFVNIFEGTFGFGSVHDGKLSIAHPDGTLVRPANSGNVYLLQDGKARFATSLGVFRSWGFDFNRVKIASQGDLDLMAAADADTSHTNNPPPLTFREGALIKGSGPTVYVVQIDSGVVSKRSLDSLENFQRLGYRFSEVIAVPDSELPATTGPPITMSDAAHPDGTMVKDANSPTVYFVLGGERHSMTSLPIFISHGYTFDQVHIATPGDNALPVTWAVTWYGEGMLLKGSGSTVYITDNDETGIHTVKRSLGTYYNFVGLDFRFSEVMNVSDGDLPSSNGPDIGL